MLTAMKMKPWLDKTIGQSIHSSIGVESVTSGVFDSAKEQKTSPTKILYRVIIGLIVFLFAVLILDRASDSENFSIRNVEIQGNTKYIDQAQVRQLVKSQLQGNYFTINMDNLERKILELPWVYSVSIRKQWPDSLLLDLVELQPVARWREHWLSDSGAVIDKSRILEADIQAPLPKLFSAVGESVAVWQSFQTWSAKFATADMVIQEIIKRDSGDWWVKLKLSALASKQFSGHIRAEQNILSLVLSDENAGPQIEDFLRVFYQRIAHLFLNIKQVDLRYTNGFAVTWREPSKMAQLMTTQDLLGSTTSKLSISE